MKQPKTIFEYRVYPQPHMKVNPFSVIVTRVNRDSARSWIISKYPRPQYEFELNSTISADASIENKKHWKTIISKALKQL